MRSTGQRRLMMGGAALLLLARLAAAPVPATRFTTLSSAQTGLAAVNTYGDPRMWGELYREFTLGAVGTGIASGDYDDDGRPDLAVVTKTGGVHLYRQTGDLVFADTTASAGLTPPDAAWTTGVTWADINNDGRLDLYVCRFDAPNLLYLNQGDGTFTESAARLGLAIRDASVMAVFGDYDRDGRLDVYVQTNILRFSASYKGRPDYLFRQQADGTFANVTAAAGIWGPTQGHSATWWDYNDDGWPDLYVANDFETPDRLYRNNGDGTFTDVVDLVVPHTSYSSMGTDLGDVDNDGRVDFLVADMAATTHVKDITGMEEMGRGIWESEAVAALNPQYPRNALYLATGTARLHEAAYLTGLDATDWTWSVRLADLDNDGRLDAYFTNGMIRNFIDADLLDRQATASTLAARAAIFKNAAVLTERNLAYRNDGDLRFTSVGAEWGLDHLGVSFGATVADLDRDGDLDLVFTNLDDMVTLCRNDTVGPHALQLRLVGVASNRFGLGAAVRVETADGLVQARQLTLAHGTLSADEPLLHFGLGAATVARRVVIRWPSGQTQELADLAADQLHTITEPAEPAAPGPANPPVTSGRYQETARARGLDYRSAARAVNELARQKLLPRRLSGQAPALATADVNHDGVADVFVSGATGQAGALFLGTADGRFTPAPAQPWADARDADDTAALFLDANGDGHADLLVAAGGVAYPAGDARYAARLYLGDGRGAFTLAPAALPAGENVSAGACAAADFDGDGRMDVFVGGRVVPGAWPNAPRSVLYRNAGDHFEDVTDQLAPALRAVGLVTAAAWADVDGDGRADLAVATEWGPVKLFHNTGTGLDEATARVGLAGVTGWWRALTVADVNGDGRPDLVAGNVGLNTKYRATPAAPTVLFTGDLDGAGRSALVEAQHEDGRLYPLRGRSKLAYAFPWIRPRFPTYAAYAQATIDEIFPVARRGAHARLEANELASGVFLQRADGTFGFQALPRLAQLAPVNVIVAGDFDGDGVADLYVAGNDFGPEPMTGRFDGGLGLLLRGDGRGGFAPVGPAASGLLTPGEVRAALALPPLAPGGTPRLVVGQSQGAVQLFEVR